MYPRQRGTEVDIRIHTVYAGTDRRSTLNPRKPLCNKNVPDFGVLSSIILELFQKGLDESVSAFVFRGSAPLEFSMA